MACLGSEHMGHIVTVLVIGQLDIGHLVCDVIMVEVWQIELCCEQTNIL